MSARFNSALPLAAAFAFAGAVGVFAAPAPAAAGEYGGGGGGCCKPKPPCCQPPPSPPPCCAGGHKVNIPNVNVNVGATVIVNASATAIGSASANASARGGGVVFAGGGGGSSVIFSPGAPSLVGGLNVEGGKRRVAYSAKRTKIKIVVIRAVCIDDREMPHPAAQVIPDRELSDLFEGEIFRCVAGARLQVTIGDYEKRIDSDGGGDKIMNCAKGEALWRHRSTGELVCRPANAQRNCYERSLLRRYGAGYKVVKIVVEETYTAYREEQVETASAGSINMMVDGGVGGIVH
jgi:hypothetical protein